MEYDDIKNSADYKIIETLNHNNIKNFVKRETINSKGWGVIGRMYQLFGALLVLLLLSKATTLFIRTSHTQHLIAIGIGLATTFSLLIIIHELLHALAYKAIGTKHIFLNMNIKKFLFYVQADRQIFNYKQIKIVALAPAVVIFVLGTIGVTVFFGQPLYYFFATLIGGHSLFCLGDFGMLSFFENRKENTIFTVTIKSKQETYFYARR